jgi:hypothetical protein
MKKPIVAPFKNPTAAWELDLDDASFGSDFGAVDAGAGVGPIEQGIGGMILTSDNMEAIAQYMGAEKPQTAEATKIRDEFVVWYDKLWWYEKTSQANYDLARNMRNRYNIANALTAADKAQVQDVIKNGLTTEDFMGEPDRRTSSGMLPGPDRPPKDPFIPTPWLIGLGVVAGLVVVVAAHGAASAAASSAINKIT